MWQTTGGQVHDCTQGEALLDQIPPATEGEAPRSTAADKAYDTNAILQKIEALGATPVIPPRSNRLEPSEFDHHLYKKRNLIERFFCRIKQFRRIATRYEKLVERFDAFIALAGAFIWLT